MSIKKRKETKKSKTMTLKELKKLYWKEIYIPAELGDEGIAVQNVTTTKAQGLQDLGIQEGHRILIGIYQLIGFELVSSKIEVVT